MVHSKQVTGHIDTSASLKCLKETERGDKEVHSGRLNFAGDFSAKDVEEVFDTWQSEKNSEIERLEQRLPEGSEVNDIWHTPEEDGLEVLHILYSPEFPIDLTSDLTEDRSHVHEKWYEEFERLNFGIEIQEVQHISDIDSLQEETYDDWNKEFDSNRHASYKASDSKTDRLVEETEISRSSFEPIPLPCMPARDSNMDGQEVVDFLKHSLYSDELTEDFLDIGGLTSVRQSKYQSLSEATQRKSTSEILQYLATESYADEIYGSYDFAGVNAKINTISSLDPESVPNQYESALQRLKMLKRHLMLKN
ncbi:hypothetical protein K7432_011527 [Basidiobolus ranarum]|uniref:Uncharacterized protein n=1 Tax=Basidiobolus ranarum TaxID=34480 RepID=A0ABR2WM59_9FUNG